MLTTGNTVSLSIQRGRVVLVEVLLLTAILSAASPALAAASCPRTSELAMESRFMCQVCGVPLLVANSLEADRERAFISKLVSRCDTPSQIEAAMVDQYGPAILATPGTHGFALTAWLVPAAVILAAAVSIAALLLPNRRRVGQRRGPPAIPPPTDSEAERLQAALDRYDPLE